MGNYKFKLILIAVLVAITLVGLLMFGRFKETKRIHNAETDVTHVEPTDVDITPADAMHTERKSRKSRGWGSQSVAVPGMIRARILPETIDTPWRYPLNSPVVWRTVDDAAHMKPDDPVLGVHLQNKSWALPWWIMKNHHVANLTLDNQPVLINFCELCSSASAFNPIVEGKKYTFRWMGIYNGSILVSDYETDSFWAPFSGEALQGLLKGLRLDPLPLYQCTWSEWLNLHPNSLVVYGEERMREGHGHSQRPGKSSRGSANRGFFRSLLRPLDKRLPANEFVLGVQVNGQARAYPLSVLNQVGSVVNDTLGHTNIVVLHRPGTTLAIAFSRELDGETLTFERAGNGEVVDRKYKGRWTYAGESYDSPLAGRKLSFVFSGVEEWYIWAAYHPETEIFDSESVSGEIPLE